MRPRRVLRADVLLVLLVGATGCGGPTRPDPLSVSAFWAGRFVQTECRGINVPDWRSCAFYWNGTITLDLVDTGRVVTGTLTVEHYDDFLKTFFTLWQTPLQVHGEFTGGELTLNGSRQEPGGGTTDVSLEGSRSGDLLDVRFIHRFLRNGAGFEREVTASLHVAKRPHQ